MTTEKKTQWQPIETAPKTSKAILVYCAHRRNTYTAYYSRKDEFVHTSEWRHFGGVGEMAEDPTHWMPIPAGPK